MLLALGSLGSLVACSRERADPPAAGGRIADVPGELGGRDTAAPRAPAAGTARDSTLGALGQASNGEGAVYRPTRDTAMLHAGTISGRVESAKVANGDTVITPTHDLAVCKPFTDSPLPSRDGGVGNAVVWLLGVEAGPVQDAPRRAELTLDRCQLDPRVQRMAVGGTLMVTSRDAMMSRLRFAEVPPPMRVRATLFFNDAGQVVPSEAIAATAGLIAVRDDLHPWVRAFVVASAHPFVAITEPDGRFHFETVPPGRYTLVVWQEKLGVRTHVLRVTSGVDTKITMKFEE